MRVENSKQVHQYRRYLVENYLDSKADFSKFMFRILHPPKKLYCNNLYSNNKFDIFLSNYYKTIFDTDYNAKLLVDDSYLNLFYFYYKTNCKEINTKQNSLQKIILFLPTNRITLWTFYWYKYFLVICRRRNYQIIATTSKQWERVLWIISLIHQMPTLINISCRLPQALLKADIRSLPIEQYIFPCFDKKCDMNNLYRMLVLADLVIIEAQPPSRVINFILNTCATHNKAVRYKPQWECFNKNQSKINNFFVKNNIKKITLGMFFRDKWNY